MIVTFQEGGDFNDLCGNSYFIALRIVYRLIFGV